MLEVYTCILQGDGKVAFEEIPQFGVCRPACHDSSLYLFVLVICNEAVALIQAYSAFNIFYMHLVNVDWGVAYNHHICLVFVMFIFTTIWQLQQRGGC